MDAVWKVTSPQGQGLGEGLTLWVLPPGTSQDSHREEPGQKSLPVFFSDAETEPFLENILNTLNKGQLPQGRDFPEEEHFPETGPSRLPAPPKVGKVKGKETVCR